MPTSNPLIKELTPAKTINFLGIYIPKNDPYARKAAIILSYLMGLETNSEGLDLNTDGKINIADAVKNIQSMPATVPASPNPADGVTTITVTTSLDWADATRASTYDLYFWPSTAPKPDSPTTTGLTRSFYNLPAPLAYNTSYHWQVIAINEATGKQTPGPEWTFTTMPQPIQVIQPNGGETWTVGSTEEIHWKTVLSIGGTGVRFEIWRNGQLVSDLGEDWNPSGEGIKQITVPDVPAENNYRIRAISTYLESIGFRDSWDESDGFITIESGSNGD